MAASIRDVCRKNPDRGVDLILSVSTCIESQDPTIQALGFESLSHLCEADVIDFYSAWDVISNNVLDSSGNPQVARCACLLLRWGAVDAEAYPEAARNVLQILWDVGTSRHSGHGSLWAKARVSAYNALTHYEVVHIQKSIPDFKKRNMELLTSETDPEVLRAMEVFEVKIIRYEHITRRRFVKEKRVAVNKIEKLLDVFPQVIFASGNTTGASQLPGAALFCLSLTPKDMTKGQQKVEGLQDVHAKYENALVEIAASLQLSRNILIALLSLQSWKPFMQRWLRACVTFLDAKAPSTVLDKTSKAANGILKIIKRLAEESIPRSAENITLALGALCERAKVLWYCAVFATFGFYGWKGMHVFLKINLGRWMFCGIKFVLWDKVCHLTLFWASVNSLFLGIALFLLVGD
ncbi:protein RST1-like [Camellia sinensis]|uniref:protein RST1-like n=1 Tax=Camellia sinensis TaxID=4442 RepID=UPI0010364A38|nr:protein RST1-like [Camellia sinensis]